MGRKQKLIVSLFKGPTQSRVKETTAPGVSSFTVNSSAWKSTHLTGSEARTMPSGNVWGAGRFSNTGHKLPGFQPTVDLRNVLLDSHGAF